MIIIIYLLLNIMILLGNPTFSNSFSIYNATMIENEEICYNKIYSLSSYWEDLGSSLKLINKNITFNKNDKWFLRYYDGLHESLIYPNIIMNSVIYNQTWNLTYKGAVLYGESSKQFGMVTTNSGGFYKRQFSTNAFNIYDYEKSVFVSNKVNNISSWYNKKIIRIDDEIDIDNNLIFDLGSVYYNIFLNSTYCNVSLGKFEKKLINGTNIASVSSFSINFIDNIQEEILNDICLSIIYPFTDAIRLNFSSQFTFNNNTISDIFYNIFLNPYNFLNLSSINDKHLYL